MAESTRRWSAEVTEKSDALDLEQDARSLKQSADKSKRRKAGPFRSAMSMLTFYINRAGKGLPDKQAEVLEDAKDELRDLYGRPRKAK